MLTEDCLVTKSINAAMFFLKCYGQNCDNFLIYIVTWMFHTSEIRWYPKNDIIINIHQNQKLHVDFIRSKYVDIGCSFLGQERPFG